MIEKNVDVLIIGGGLIGASLMCALKDMKLNILLVDSQFNSNNFSVSPTGLDVRTLALSPASVGILESIFVWPLVKEKATPIEVIHISEQGQFGNACLYAGNTPLGFVVEVQELTRALYQVCTDKSSFIAGNLKSIDKELGLAYIQQNDQEICVRAKIIVAADGTNSSVRQTANLSVERKDYNRQALVANINLKRKHANFAYERFTSSGSLALLPMGGERVSLVWILKPLQAKEYQIMSEKDFLKNLQLNFGYRLGRFTKVGSRFTYPIQQVSMTKPVHWPIIFIGNAAHTLHPVAGQGFNLGLRDVATLAQCIFQYGLNSSMFLKYALMRRDDERDTKLFTDRLVEIFANRIPGMGVLRGLSLATFDNSKNIQKLLTRIARGYSGIIPDLALGLALTKEQK